MAVHQAAGALQVVAVHRVVSQPQHSLVGIWKTFRTISALIRELTIVLVRIEVCCGLAIGGLLATRAER